MAVYFAARDLRIPWLARGLALVVAAYALSPIDLIPDFIPVLGLLDDLLLVSLGMLLVVRMLPAEVLAESRHKADAAIARGPSRAAMAVVICTWLLAAAALAYWWLRR